MVNGVARNGQTVEHDGVRVVRAEVSITEVDGLAATSVVTIDPAEEVFAGHYPGFPILPGVCLLEIVMRAAAQCGPAADLAMSNIESIRFLHPVFPRDELTTALSWSPDGAGWVLRAIVRCGETICVRARLRYSVPAAAEGG